VGDETIYGDSHEVEELFQNGILGFKTQFELLKLTGVEFLTCIEKNILKRVMCILPVPVESRYFQIASSVLAR
jgi:hypothetical protein